MTETVEGDSTEGSGGGGLTPPSQTPYFHALERDRYQRQEQIRRIEAHTGRRLICLACNPWAEITRDMVTVFADLLHDVDGEDLDLLLNTSGGDIDAAEKLVIMCRARAKSFRVIVPESAKSAGTMMACAADSIVMGFASELGPIDAQIYVPDSKGQPVLRAAHSFLAGFEDIKKAAGFRRSVAGVLPAPRQARSGVARVLSEFDQASRGVRPYLA